MEKSFSKSTPVFPRLLWTKTSKILSLKNHKENNNAPRHVLCFLCAILVFYCATLALFCIYYTWNISLYCRQTYTYCVKESDTGFSLLFCDNWNQKHTFVFSRPFSPPHKSRPTTKKSADLLLCSGPTGIRTRDPTLAVQPRIFGHCPSLDQNLQILTL